MFLPVCLSLVGPASYRPSEAEEQDPAEQEDKPSNQGGADSDDSVGYQKLKFPAVIEV